MIDVENREALAKLIDHNLLFPSEAASLLGVSRAAFSNMVARGNFRPIKSGIGGNLFLRSDILRYKDAKEYMKSVRKGAQKSTDNQPVNYPLLLNLADSDDADTATNQQPKEGTDPERTKASEPANWAIDDCDSGEPDGYAAFIEAHCPNCNFSTGIENGQYGWYYGDPFPWHYCPNCGTLMRSREKPPKRE